MNIHYKKEFSEALISSAKKHTIRKCNVAVGSVLKHIIYPYHPKKRKCILENTCVSVQEIEIIPNPLMHGGKVYVDGRLLGLGEMEKLAMNDAFDNLLSFWLYFDDPFKGYIIHWTETKY